MSSSAPPFPDLTLRLDIDRLSDDLSGPGWSVHTDALASDALRWLRNTASRDREQGSFRQAGIGRGRMWRLDRSLRGDDVLWVDPDDADAAPHRLFQAFRRLVPELNARLFLGLVDYEAHLAVYPAGAAYRRHRDHFLGSEARLITTTLYLNDAWETNDGGAIRLFLPNDRPLEILPVGGTLVAFLSRDFEHEVLPARRERWSWTGWFRRSEAPIPWGLRGDR